MRQEHERNERDGARQKPDINRASREELERAEGIDGIMADHIVRYREEHGPIRDAEDLKAVPGIGDVRYEQVLSAVRLSDGTSSGHTEQRREDDRERGRESAREHASGRTDENRERARRSGGEERGQSSRSGKPDINSASVEELQAVPGIDGELARRIAANRPFHSTADVDRLFEIGDRRIELLREHLRVPDSGTEERR